MSVEWTQLMIFTPANPTVTVPWLMALEDFSVATHLRIQASGTWTVGTGVLPACEPDGLPGLALPAAQLIIEGCRFGALIGKLGGSSAVHQIPADATKPLAENQPFPIGVYCVTKVPDGNIGPLYIGFNTPARPIDITSLTVTIHGARP